MNNKPWVIEKMFNARGTRERGNFGVSFISAPSRKLIAGFAAFAALFPIKEVKPLLCMRPEEKKGGVNHRRIRTTS
jgi:hypothetical protein